ncbi:YfhO family protein [Parasediminibacterium sp. JCM 36343]|uniref:YfhO family protein n=1 Tax=Parasediminibacterium sp. JCM 36343 TaxID=3374279 RepID=UPI00397AB48C
MKQFNWKPLLPHIVAVLTFLILSIIYSKPALDGKVVEQHDVQQWKAMAHQSYVVREKNGYFPLWTNSMFSGMPAYQIAMESKDPPYINVYYFHELLTLGLPKPTYYLFFCCLGFYFLAVVMGVNPWLSIAGGLAYGYCSYDPIIITAGHDTKLMSIAYAPAILASMQLLFKKRYWIGSIMLLLTTVGLFVQSHQQIAYYTLLMAVCMSIPFLIKTIKEKDFKHLAFTFVLSVVCSTLSVLYVANSYLPTYEYSKETMRGGGSGLTLGNADKKNKTVGGLDKDYAFRWSYGIGETLTLMVPNAFGGGSSTTFGDDSKVAALLQNSPEIPQQAVQQLYQAASAYWGDQPGTSGPVYLGAFVCLMGLAGFILSSNKNKWWLLAITIFGIVLAWGKNLEAVNYFLFDYLPFYKKFRAPSMSLVMPQLSVGLMATLFINEFIDTATDKEKQAKVLKQFLIIAASCVGLLLAFYLFASFSNANTLALKKNLENAFKGNDSFIKSYMQAWADDRKELYFKDMLRSLGIMAVAVAAFYAYAKGMVKKPIVIAAFILLAMIDLMPIGKRYFSDDNFVEPETYELAYQKTKADEALDKDTSFYRILNLAAFNGSGYSMDMGSSFNDALASYHHNTIGGYHPAKLSIYNDLIEFQIYKNIQAWGSNPNAKDSFPVLNMLNMKYVIVPDQRDPKQTMAVPNPYALGNCWLVKELKFVKNADEEMTSMDHFNPAQTAIVNESFKAAAGNPPTFDSTASIKFIENRNDYIKYESNAAANQFAVFSEIYYSQGWNSYIDGKKVDYCKVNYALRGMAIPAGKHLIEFKFEPSLVHLGEQLGKYSGILSAILVLLFGFLEWKEYKKRI